MSFYTERVFPKLLHIASRHFDEQRRELLAHARGRVLELGVGTGASLGFYPEEVTDVVGLDPSPGVLVEARRTVARLRQEGVPYRIQLHRGDAEQLPYDDGSFDTVVAFLTLCTIPDFAAAAAEAHRVLRADGALLVLEHVKAPDGSRLERWQRRLDPLWTRAAAGCHLDRDTGHVLREAGFTGPLARYRDRRASPLLAPQIRGVLRKG